MNWKTIAALSLAIFSIAIVCAFADDSADADGTSIGTNVTATYDSGTLTITATAAGAIMTDWSAENQVPWYSYRSDITAVVFNGAGTLTNIGSYAFSGCSSLSEIDMPGSVTAIGSNAFSSSGITHITMPSVTSIGSYAFSGCTSLGSFIISSSSVTINGYAFQGCTGLESMAFFGSVVNNDTSIEFYNGGTKMTTPSDFQHHTFYLMSGETNKYEIKEIATGSSYRIYVGDNLVTTFSLAITATSTVSVEVDGTALLPAKFSAQQSSENNFSTELTVDGTEWSYVGTYTLYISTGYGNVTQTVTVANSSHTVTFRYNDDEGTQATPSVADGECAESFTPVWQGFTFVNWFRGDNVFDFSTPITTDGIVLDARWTMDDPVLDTSAFQTTVYYDGEPHFISVRSDLAPTQNVSYQWYEYKHGEWVEIAGATESSYPLINVSDSGSFRVHMTKGTYGGGSAPFTAVIEKREIILSVTPAPYTYDGNIPTNIEIDVSTGYPTGSPESLYIVLNASGKDVGTYAYGASTNYYTLSDWAARGSTDLNNYDVSTGAKADLSIIKRNTTLTISSDTQLYYDGQNTKEVTSEVDGVSGEFLKVTVTMFVKNIGTYQFNTVAASGKYTVGAWQSTDTGNINNYNITSVTKQDLTVSPKNETLNIISPSFTYNASTSAMTYDVVTSVEGEHLQIVLTAYSCNADEYEYSATAGVKKYTASSWQSTATGDVSNYNITTSVRDNLIINKKAVTITADPQSISYGDSLTANAVDEDGLISGHTVHSVVLTKSNPNVPLPGEDRFVIPSEAVIWDGSSKPVTSNYDITYANGSLTISKKEVTLNIPASSFTYDAVTTSMDVEVSTGVDSEKLKITLTAFARDHAEYIYSATAGEGKYTIGDWQSTIVGNVNNYGVTTGTCGTLTINKRAVTLNVPAGSFEYDGNSTFDITVLTGYSDDDLVVTITTASADAYESYTYGTGEMAAGQYRVITWKSGDDGNINNYTVTVGSDNKAITITKSTKLLNIPVNYINYDGSSKSTEALVTTGIGSEVLGVTLTAYSFNAGEYVYSTGAGEGKYTIGPWIPGTGGGKPSNYELNIGAAESFYIKRIDITVTADDQTITYGTSIDSTVSSIMITSGSLLMGDSITDVKLTKDITDAGTGKITITENSVKIMNGSSEDVTDNYNITLVQGNVTITQANVILTIEGIAAAYNASTSREIEIKTNVPSAENSETLKASILLSSANAGDYSDTGYTFLEWKDSITGKVTNYNISLPVKGTVTVPKCDVTMNVQTRNITYDGLSSERILDYPTGVSNETLRVRITTSSANVGTYVHGTGENTYTASPWESGRGDISNYNVTAGEDYGTMLIVTKELYLTVTDQTKVYDGQNMRYVITTANLSGLVNGDQVTGGSIVTLTPDAGSRKYYDIDWGFDVPLTTKNGITNYNCAWGDLKYTNVDFTIQPRTISIKSMTSTTVGTSTTVYKCERIQEIGEMGYVSGEILNYDFTGVQNGIGTSKNTFSCTDDTGKVANYNIIYRYGTLKVMVAADASVNISVTSDSLTEQQQADIIASVKYNKSKGITENVVIATTKTEMNTTSEFIRTITVDLSTPICISTSDGKITLTGPAIKDALSGTSSFRLKLAYANFSSDKYAVQYEIVMEADGKAIHEIGDEGLAVSFYIDSSKVFPVNRTFKVVCIDNGDKYDASFDGQTGEISFTAHHMSYFAVTMAENTGGPSFTGVILVIVISLVLAIIAGVAIYYLKKNYYI